MLYRKLPVTIEAIQWTGFNHDEVVDFGSYAYVSYDYRDDKAIQLWNILENCWVRCPAGHWIIKGVKGEIYPCDQEVFEQTYEPVD